MRPLPRPAFRQDAPLEQPLDLSRAVPARTLSQMPSSAQQLQALNSRIEQGTPQVTAAREKRDALSAQAANVRKRLIATASQIGQLEIDREAQTQAVGTLVAEDARLGAGFARDRVAVTQLLAVLQRLQHDMPPALALKPDDALGAARGSMLIGASLPPVYARAAALSRRLEELARTRAELASKRQQADVTEKSLTTARGELVLLLAEKEREAQDAAGTYGTLQKELAGIAAQAADFRMLLARIARLRRADAPDGVVTVESRAGGGFSIAKGSLLPPVVGQVTVRSNDEVLAGEPVGTMPGKDGDGRLYFELRSDGKWQDPAPWLSIDLRKAKK